MNINHIRYFVAIFEEGSISAAAKSMDITMQAVSKALNDLEAHYDEKLFERKKGVADPTLFGRGLYPKARATLDSYDELLAISPANLTTAFTKEPQRYRIALCSPGFKDNGKLRESLSNVIQQSTGLSVDFTLEMPNRMQHALEAGTYDALVTIGAYEHERVTCKVVGTMPTGIMISKFHPLAKKDFVALEDLAAYPAGFSVQYDGHNQSIYALYNEAGYVAKSHVVSSLAEAAAFMTLHSGYFFSCVMPHLTKSQTGTIVKQIEPAQDLRVPICFNTLEASRTPTHHLIENFMLHAIESSQ